MKAEHGAIKSRSWVRWMHALLSVFALVGVLGLSPGHAAASPLADAPDATAAGAPDASTEPVSNARVAVPEPSERAMEYYRSGNVLWGVEQVWGLAIPLLLLFTGISARMRDAAGRFGRHWVVVLLGYFVLYTVLMWVLDRPLAYYSGFVRPHDYGLSEQAFSKWFGDSVKTLVLSLVMGGMFVWIPFALLRKSPQRWWLWTSVVAIPLILVMLLIAPVFISPMFNDFGPMKDTQLEAQILALAERAGIEGSRVFEVEKSVDTNTVNAYVAGLGATKRIVLWDTIIARLEPRELLFVMGHEMGHYVLGHVVNMMLIMVLVVPLTLFVAHKVAHWAIAKWSERFGFRDLHDPAAIPLIVVIVGMLSFVLTPAMTGWSRHQEHESDRFGLEISHDNHACASAFAKLQEQNLGNPRPGLLFKLWRASHPPLGERIEFCNDYRPWETGEPERYHDLFK